MLNEPYPLLLCAILAVGKEAYDQIDYGGWDWYDLLATLAGGAATYLLLLGLNFGLR